MIIGLSDFYRVIAETSTGCLLAGSALGKRGMSARDAGHNCLRCPNFFRYCKTIRLRKREGDINFFKVQTRLPMYTTGDVNFVNVQTRFHMYILKMYTTYNLLLFCIICLN